MAKTSIIQIVLQVLADKAIAVLKSVKRGLTDLNDKQDNSAPENLDQLTDAAKKSGNEVKTLGERFLALKNRIESLAGGGFALGAIFKLAKDFIAIKATNWLEGLKDKSDQLSMTRNQLSELNAAREEQRQRDTNAMQQLGVLASAQQLSNTQSAKAAELLSDLARRYGDLGLSIDSTTGKINGYAEATVKLAERQKAARIAEAKKDIANMRDNIASNRDTIANDTGWQAIKTQGKSTEYANNAAKENLELNSKIAAKQQELRDLENQNPNKARQEAADALIASTREQLEIDLLEAQGLADQAKERRLMAEYQQKGTPLTAKELQSLVQMQMQYDKMTKAAIERRQWTDIGAQTDADRQSVKDATSDIEFEINYQKMKNAGLVEEAERLKIVNDLRKTKTNWTTPQIDSYADKKSQLNDLKLDDMIARERLQAQVQALRNKGLDDEADRLQAINDLKAQGIDYTKEEAKFNDLLAVRKAAREGKSPDKNDDKPQVDQYAQLGLFNFGVANVNDRLDVDRNRLLTQIAENTARNTTVINEV